jgi:hypothetical protein
VQGIERGIGGGRGHGSCSLKVPVSQAASADCMGSS